MRRRPESTISDWCGDSAKPYGTWMVQQDVIKRNVVKRQACTSRNLGLVVCSAPPVVPRVKKPSDNKEPPDRCRRWTIARCRQVAEAPTKPISGAVSHCATQYVQRQRRGRSMCTVLKEGGGLLVSGCRRWWLEDKPRSVASAVGETLTSLSQGMWCIWTRQGNGASCTDRVTGRGVA